MAFDLSGKAVRQLRIPTVNYSNSPLNTAYAQTGDVNSRFFIVELYDDVGAIDLANYDKVFLNVTLPDAQVETVAGEINEKKNRVICKLPSVSTDGSLICDISLSGVDGNGEAVYLTSQGFSVSVLKSQANDQAVEGDDDFPILVQLINEVAQIADVEALRAEAEENRALSESERQAAEGLRKDAEKQRESSETLREQAEELRQEVVDNLLVNIENIEASKQDKVEFDGNYDRKTNKAATVNTVINKIAEVIANAPEDFDTLKELADWLVAHGKDAAAMNSQIGSNKDNIEKLSSKVDTSVETITNNISSMRSEILGVSGTITLQVGKWTGNVYSVALENFGSEDAIFFSPISIEDKTVIETANIYVSTSENTITFEAVKIPESDIKLNYFIARGKT